jgi:preprotein translocase SecF subunit
MKIINFYKYRISAFIFSFFLILFSIFLFIKDNLNLGIDFKGGFLIEVNFPNPPNLSDLREKLISISVGNIEIQEFGSPENILIRIEKNSEKKDEQNALINNIKNELPSEIDYRRIEFVGPKVGKELQIMGIKAVLFSLVAMFIYIWFRFSGWQFGLGALVALFHDVISTVGFFSLTQIEFNLASIAAILTIAGYSINDTVVVFDRIRENLTKDEMPFAELLNLSISQTMSRTIMTSLTTMLALLALFIFGGEVVKGFVSAMIWGVLVGTYSSIFIASPLIVLLGFKKANQSQ